MLLPAPTRRSPLMGTNFPGELEILLLSGALTNKLPVLCAGKMSSFSAERMVNLHLNEYFFLEGIFRSGTNKFFSRVNGLTCGMCVLAAPSHPQRNPACSPCLFSCFPAWTGQGRAPKSIRRRQTTQLLPAQLAGLETAGVMGKAEPQNHLVFLPSSLGAGTGREVVNCHCPGRAQKITVAMNCLNYLEGGNLVPYVMCQYVGNVPQPLR